MPGPALHENGANRTGVPFTMYFSAEQAQALTTVSRHRRVSKSTLVRYAVERLLEQLESGHLDLPFGFKD
jgi:predicted DNA-binding protein